MFKVSLLKTSDIWKAESKAKRKTEQIHLSCIMKLTNSKPCNKIRVVTTLIVITIIAANIYQVLLSQHCDKFLDHHIPYFADGETETELK